MIVKNSLILLPLVALLFGCAGLPEPRTADDALILGGLALEFPDGFLSQPPRTVESNLLLYFRDLTTSRRFCRSVSDGHFVFLGSGGHRYRLERYEYSYQDRSEELYLNDRIDWEFASEPGKLVYVGQLILRYTQPRESNRVSFARSTDLEGARGSFTLEGERFFMALPIQPAYWRYARNESRRWDEAQALAFLKSKDPSSPWLDRPLVRSE